MSKCIIPGTFDPIHKGHFAIIKRAKNIFDTVIVAVADSKHKHPKYSLEQRTQMAQEMCAGIDGVIVKSFDCLLVDFAKQEGVNCIVKGLRDSKDFEYESNMSAVNKKLSNSLDTLFFVSDPDKINISSTHVKELQDLGIDTSTLTKIKE